METTEIILLLEALLQLAAAVEAILV